jgi:tRNA 2-thiouridine synthesizing protein A
MQESDTYLKYDDFLDAKGLNCPLPVLKTKLALNRMHPEQVLRVETTDPHSTIDFKAYCARSGHEIIRLDESDNVIIFYIKHNKPE